MRRAALLGMALALGCQRKAPPPPPPTELQLVAVGDIMMHQDVKRAAQEAPGGFQELWGDLAPLFQKADLVFGNLETPLAPRTGSQGRPFSFNAPEGLAPALRESHFQILATANNHAYDQGPRGVGETLEILGRNGLASIGTGSSRSQAEAPQILERHGIRIGFFGATDIFNSNLNGAETGPWVNALDVERLVAAVRQLRPQVDAVVVSLHWGEEYRHLPSQRQRDVAARLVEAGVDLVIGHHPHVLQPLAWVEAGGRRGAVAYSLGNFISNQDRTYNPAHMAVQAGDSRDGAALKATWIKDAAGSAHLAGVTMEPLWTENNAIRPAGARRAIRVVRIGQRTGPLAELRQRRILDVLAGVAAPPPVRLAKVARRPVLRVAQVPLPPPAPSPDPEPPGAELPVPVPAEAPTKVEALP